MRAHRVRLSLKALNYDALTRVHRDDARGNPCLYCWDMMAEPTWDHVIPISQGGPNNRGNLVVVCSYCNHCKGDLSLPEYLGVLSHQDRRQAHRVRLFLEWVMSDWTLDERAMCERIVAHRQEQTRRARRQELMIVPPEIKGALSRYLRAQVQRRERDLLLPSPSLMEAAE